MKSLIPVPTSHTVQPGTGLGIGSPGTLPSMSRAGPFPLFWEKMRAQWRGVTFTNLRPPYSCNVSRAKCSMFIGLHLSGSRSEVSRFSLQCCWVKCHRLLKQHCALLLFTYVVVYLSVKILKWIFSCYHHEKKGKKEGLWHYKNSVAPKHYSGMHPTSFYQCWHCSVLAACKGFSGLWSSEIASFQPKAFPVALISQTQDWCGPIHHITVTPNTSKSPVLFPIE